MSTPQAAHDHETQIWARGVFASRGKASGRHIPLVLVLGLIPPGLGLASSSTNSRLTELGKRCGLSEPQFLHLGHTGDHAWLGSQGPGSWQTWVQILTRSSERSLWAS